jgi:flagellar hook-length control protein FliK
MQTDAVQPAQPDGTASLADASADRPLPKDVVAEQPADPLPLPDPTVAATGIATPPVTLTTAPPIIADASSTDANAPTMPATITTYASAQPTAKLEVNAQSAVPQGIAPADTAAASPPTLTPNAPPPARESVKAEALSLLQLVRDHMTSRTTSVQPTEAVQRPETDRDTAAPLSSMSRTDTAAVPTPTTLQPVALAPVMTTAPVADLSASLGAQMVDMGVSGQWIDSLARDIAGLSANGAQGRFQINADTLGPIQVDIQQGDKGATVALTVASDLAEQALRQDGDRLRLDAGLAAVKISEVKIERAPAATDATRPDPSGQNTPGQQQQQQAGQPAFQGQGQGRWQARENIAQSHKAADDAAVLNHAEAGDNTRDAVRARYA